jgi:hypothetical protein
VPRPGKTRCISPEARLRLQRPRRPITGHRQRRPPPSHRRSRQILHQRAICAQLRKPSRHDGCDPVTRHLDCAPSVQAVGNPVHPHRCRTRWCCRNVTWLVTFRAEPTGEREPKAASRAGADALSWAAEIPNPIAKTIRSTRITFAGTCACWERRPKHCQPVSFGSTGPIGGLVG